MVVASSSSSGEWHGRGIDTDWDTYLKSAKEGPLFDGLTMIGPSGATREQTPEVQSSWSKAPRFVYEWRGGSFATPASSAENTGIAPSCRVFERDHDHSYRLRVGSSERTVKRFLPAPP